MILVTGATGHIGNVLVQRLISDYPGEKIRIFILPKENLQCFDGLQLELFYGDIRKTQEVFNAVKGSRLVFHLAGLVDTSSRHPDRLYDINVGGTKNVIAACLAHSVERLIYVSSVHALPDLPKEQIIFEGKEFPYPDLLGNYAKSKTQATAEVYRGVSEGLDAVIVFPSGIIGPFDYKLSEMGRLFRYLSTQGWLKLVMAIDGAYDFVDVRDIVQGLILAAEKGRKGEGYILSGHNISMRELIRREREILGQKQPRIFFAPRWIVRTGAALTSFFSRVFFFRPFFTPYSVSVLMSNSRLSHAKARAELGYQPRPLAVTLKDTLIWMQQQGQIRIRQAAGNSSGG